MPTVLMNLITENSDGSMSLLTLPGIECVVSVPVQKTCFANP